MMFARESKLTRKGSDGIAIDAPASEIWAFLADPLMIPKWNSLVRGVTVPGGQREHKGAKRSCEVEFGGKKGRVEERCVECIPNEKLTHILEADDLGICQLFSGFAFSATLSPTGDGATRLSLETYYRPRGALAWVLNRLVLRRKFGAARREMLVGLKELCEMPSQRSSPVDEVRRKPLNRALGWG